MADDGSVRMTLQEFILAVESGGYIDYDGYGFYATSTEESNEIVLPSDVLNGCINRAYTHVVWFNR